MSVHLHPHLAIYWLVVIAAKVFLAILVCTRPSHRRNRFFIAFAITWAARSATLWILSWFNLAWPYTYVYWIVGGLLHGLAFASGYECFRQLFSPWKKLPRSFANAFIFFVVAVSSVAVALTYFIPELAGPNGTAVNNAIDRTLAVWICGLFWLLSFASDWLSIPWSQRSFGIGIGFLFSYSVDFFLTILRGINPWQFVHYLWPIGFSVDLICALIWIFYFIRKEPELTPPNPQHLEEIFKMLQQFRVARSERIRLIK